MVDWPIWVKIATSVAGILIAGIITWFVKNVIKKIRSPKLSLEIKSNSKNSLIYLTLRILNDRNKKFEGKAYWHLFLDDRLKILNSTHGHEQITHKIDDDHFLHFRDMVNKPIFTDSPLECMRIEVQSFEDQKFDVRGYLSTEYGKYPKSLRGERKNTPLSQVPILATIKSNEIETYDFPR